MRLKIILSEECFEAVRAVLLYLHTDKLEVDGEHAVEVLQLAERWNLPRLSSMAQDAITRRITPDTACTLLRAADKLHAGELRALCLSFILRAILALCKRVESFRLSTRIFCAR